MNVDKEGIKLTLREAELLLRAARKSHTAEGVRSTLALKEGIRLMRLHMNSRCLAGCGEKVPEYGLACSVACARKLPPPRLVEGRVALVLRPKTGEVWRRGNNDEELEITTVDPAGRLFYYVCNRPYGKRFGSLGQSEVLDGRCARIKEA